MRLYNSTIWKPRIVFYWASSSVRASVDRKDEIACQSSFEGVMNTNDVLRYLQQVLCDMNVFVNSVGDRIIGTNILGNICM